MNISVLKKWVILSFFLSSSVTLSSCDSGGSGGHSDQPADFSSVAQLVDAFPVEDMAVMIGDGNGVLYQYEKGAFTVETPVLIASANKWLTGATIWRLIEQGLLSRQDRPHQYIDFWASDPTDPRSQITLDNLLGLTSGFNNSPVDTECINNPLYSLYNCINLLFDGGLDTEPGIAYAYGPEHFQIAALMASEAMAGENFQVIMREVLFDPLEMSSATGYALPNNDNARYSGSIQSTAADYGRFLQALLAGDIITDMADFYEDRTREVEFVFRPDGVETNNLDWHYAFGFWIECDAVPFNSECHQQPTISSPGAFGFTPWVDFKNGYWGIIAFQGGESGSGFRPSFASVGLEQELQELLQGILN